MIEKNKVILFPTDRIVNKGTAKQDPIATEKIRQESTKEFVEGNVSCAYLIKIDNNKKETIIEARDFKDVVKNEPAEFKSPDELKQEAEKIKN